jgi:hypothetical protein
MVSNTQVGQLIKVKSGNIAPAARTAGAVNGTGVDRLAPVFNSAVLVVQSGAATGSPASLTLDAKIQHSDDNSSFSDYTPPSGTAAITQITASSTVERKNVDLSGAKKYVRVVLTVGLTGGTSPTLPSSALLVLGGAQELPVGDV